MKKGKILFVDDEPNVLSGLRRSLRPLRSEWDMAFLDNGLTALKELEKERFDAIVSDMRMSPMDGASLLTEVMHRWPETVRIILSGQSKKEGILRSFGCAHQYLSKPCRSEDVETALRRACRIRSLIRDSQMGFMMKLKALPSPSKVYDQLTRELLNDEPSITNITDIIAGDVSVAAKILNIVNSPYFGFSREISDVYSAVVMIGLDSILPIALLGSFLSQMEFKNMAQLLSMEHLFEHSSSVARITERILTKESKSTHEVKEGFSCGLLHDCGLLVLAANLGTKYDDVLSRAKEQSAPLHEIEREMLDITHAEVGAYLLDLWGLPDTIIESAAFHHEIGLCDVMKLTPAIVVHVADVIDIKLHEKHPCAIEEAHLDKVALEKSGLLSKAEGWLDVFLGNSQ